MPFNIPLVSTKLSEFYCSSICLCPQASCPILFGVKKSIMNQLLVADRVVID